MMYGRRSIFLQRRRRTIVVAEKLSSIDLSFDPTQTQEELWSVIPSNSFDNEVFLHPFPFVPCGHHERFRQQPSFAIDQHRVVCPKAFHHRKLETQPTDQGKK